MKTKEQILEWLNKQPWKNEFYENCFRANVCKSQLAYDEYFINKAFEWSQTKQGHIIWKNRKDDFRKWYNSTSKPMSWKEYCEQNPKTGNEYMIDTECNIEPVNWCDKRYADTDVNVMSKELCEAFVAYMKLIQLRNAWVKKYDYMNMRYRVIARNGDIKVNDIPYNVWGLSFADEETAREFISTFKDLLEIAKPLI